MTDDDERATPAATEALELTIDLGPEPASATGAAPDAVSALWMRPDGARAAYLLAHGAGAGMRHAFLEQLAAALAARGVATLRYQFPYVEAGRRRPDPPALLERTVRAAAAEVIRRAPDLPLVAGGKSMGGRMTSQAQAAAALPGVRGLAFVCFPLHPAGKPSVTRAEHLARVAIPMLFLSGTRDELATLDLLEPVVAGLGPLAELSLVDGADHSFRVPARSGRRAADVIGGLADAIAAFASRWAG
ncbi:MAG TPA: alpha/beta family hydrolase [Kofleriaceae bacterium]|nr:alpha/beta family hydrolase [Kofleriaceae bacterium]